MTKDPRIPYGVFCTWWDSIDKVGTRGGIPVCPYCRNVLFEVSNLEQWMESARKYEADGRPGYVKKLEWMRGKCFPDMAAVDRAYAEAQKHLQ